MFGGAPYSDVRLSSSAMGTTWSDYAASWYRRAHTGLTPPGNFFKLDNESPVAGPAVEESFGQLESHRTIETLTGLDFYRNYVQSIRPIADLA